MRAGAAAVPDITPPVDRRQQDLSPGRETATGPARQPVPPVAPGVVSRKPAVLFVDDEPRVLDGIRRSLRSRRHDWDMDFKTDGAAAIEHLAQAPCDVVVSDMRMPHMDGAQLLAQVSAHHPAAARVVLSGHSEQEAGLRASVVGHRFLSKPCDGEALTGLLDQLTRGLGGGRDAQLRRAAGAVHCLPILPQQLERVTWTLAVPDVGLPEVVEAVTNSIGLAAKVLQLVNSSFFCTRNRVTSLPYAVTALGLPTVQALLAADRTRWAVPATAGREELQGLDALWRHSVATARLVRELASPANAPYSEAAALLQDAGRLALLGARAGGEWGTSPSADTPHANDVGAHLLQLWGLPRPIVVAVADRYVVREPEPYGLGVSGALRTAHLLLQDTSCADPHDGAHEDELAALLTHPQLTADDRDWRARADRVSQETARALA